MALTVKATAAPNQASTSILITDTTLPYNATTNPTGYGGINRDTTDNIETEIIPTWPDGTVGDILLLDGTTLPTTQWIPRNALSAYYSLADLGWSGTEFPIGVIKITYRPWFETASAGMYSVLNGNATVTRASGQVPSTDFADSNMIRLDGVNYTIIAKGATTLTLSIPYAGVDDASVTGYIGYEASIAAVIDRPFKVCFMPRYIANRPPNKCNKALMSTLIKLRYQWDAVYALHATPDFDAANELMIALGEECDCLASGQAAGGCSSCIS